MRGQSATLAIWKEGRTCAGVLTHLFATAPRAAAPRDDGVNIADGSWHMVTLSSSWWGPGYVVFVDGVERGALMPGAQRSTANETDREVEVRRDTKHACVVQV